jgi:hypothetical protein
MWWLPGAAQCPDHGEAAPYWVRDDRVVFKHQAEQPMPRVEADYTWWGQKKAPRS